MRSYIHILREELSTMGKGLKQGSGGHKLAISLSLCGMRRLTLSETCNAMYLLQCTSLCFKYM